MTKKPTRAAQPFKSVLCAVDFSPQSEVALHYAAVVAAHGRGRMHVLYVNDPTLVAAAAIELGNRGMAAASRRELRQLVDRTLGARATAGVTVRCHSETGDPARTIASVASHLGCDLVVTGTHGLSGVDKVLLGSTTEQLLHMTPVPMLMVPPYLSAAVGGMAPVRGWPGPTIMVTIDLRHESAEDLRAAAAVARAWDTDLLIVHVVPQRTVPPWYRADLSAHVRLQVEKARLQLEGLAGGLDDVKAEVRVLVGSPADELAAVAAEQRVSLVMMHLRRGPGLFGARAGTLAYHVLRQTVTPVLAMPGRPRRSLSHR